MKRRREIFIELTSLLDVILIMIFVLLTQARTQTVQAMDAAAEDKAAAKEVRAELKAAQKEIEELKTEAESLREEADALGRQLLSEGLVMENSLVLTLSTRADGTILLEQDGREAHSIAYSWEDGTYAYNRLKSLLLGQLSLAGEKSLFVVFQYDSEQIYHAEYELILQTIQEIRLEARLKEIPFNFLEMDIR